MKIKNLLLIPALLITLALAGCHGGSDTSSNSNTRLGNQLAASNNGLLVTNPTSSDINWGNDSLENIPVGSKGIKAIKVTNITDKPFNKLTLETSANKPQSITIDNNRTTCSMGLSLAANTSCLYVFSYSPVGGYESGLFTATVSAEQPDIKAKVAVDINYSTRVSANAGTLAVNVDTSALNCTAISCNGTLYVKNSKGAIVSTVINITGNSGTTFGTQLANLDSNDSYTIEASAINGSIPVYLPAQTVHIVASQTTTATVKYPSVIGKFGKAIITLPEVVPAYTNALTVQVVNLKNGNQVVDSGSIKQDDQLVVDLPVSDDTHDYVVKLANGIADPANGLFYDQKSVTPLEIKDSSSTQLSIPMEKSTSLSDITLKISGLQYESKTSSVTDTANISFSDANTYYKYVNQYNQSGGFKNYKVKEGLNFSIQTQANGTNSYKVNPIVNTFTVDGAKQITADFKAGANALGRANIKLDTFVPNYTDSLPLQLINTKNGNQVVKEFSLKQGESTTLFDIPVSDESHDYVVRVTEMVVDPAEGLLAVNKPQSIIIKNEKTDTVMVSNRDSFKAIFANLTISGLDKKDTATVIFNNYDKFNDNGYISSYVFVNSKNQTNGTRTYYVPNKTMMKVIANNLDGYKVNPIENYVTNSSSQYYANFEQVFAGPITYINQFIIASPTENIRTGDNAPAFTPNGKYMYLATSNRINRYVVGIDGSVTYSSSIDVPVDTGTQLYGVAISPDGLYLYAMCDFSTNIMRYSISSNGELTYQMTQRSVSTGTVSIVGTLHNKIVYALQGSSINLYELDNSGGLIFVRSYALRDSLTGISIDPKGKLLYLADVNGYIFGYSLNSDGSIGSGITYLKSPVSVAKLTISPNGKNLYVAGKDTAVYSANINSKYVINNAIVSVYSLDDNGTPSFMTSDKFSNSIFTAPSVSPNSKYFYIADGLWIKQYGTGY